VIIYVRFLMIGLLVVDYRVLALELYFIILERISFRLSLNVGLVIFLS
jgi:hypothetical protein